MLRAPIFAVTVMGGSGGGDGSPASTDCLFFADFFI
jgi:hypothetical protein